MSNLILDAATKLAAEVTQKDPSLNNNACLMALPTISYPTGKKTLSESETLVAGQKITGEALNKADLDWFPQDKLAPFNTIRKAAKNCLVRSAVEVGGLYIVSVQCLPQVMERLLEFQAEWDGHVAELTREYDNWLNAHINQGANTDLKHVIRKSALTRNEFLSGFRFTINPAMKVETLFAEQTNSFAAEVALSLWDEVAAMAEDVHKKVILACRESKLSQRGLSAVKKLRDKLVNLSFVHDGVDKIVERFDEVMTTMPKTGPVENVEFYRVAHMVLQFTSPTRLRDEADGKNAIEQYEDPHLAAADDDDVNPQVQVSTATSTAQSTAQDDTQFTDVDSQWSDNVVSINTHQDVVVDPGTAQVELDWAAF